MSEPEQRPFLLRLARPIHGTSAEPTIKPTRPVDIPQLADDGEAASEERAARLRRTVSTHVGRETTGNE